MKKNEIKRFKWLDYCTTVLTLGICLKLNILPACTAVERSRNCRWYFANRCPLRVAICVQSPDFCSPVHC